MSDPEAISINGGASDPRLRPIPRAKVKAPGQATYTVLPSDYVEIYELLVS